ncbi:DNA mismatch repair protein MutS [Butyricicoccus sp.]|uniref:DNA mismatch repair protein MutS n=1 Tax=Butyricicoccus sp. TaxID=2049021 RepID=UPI003F1407E0
MAELTPMMRQYFEIKNQNPGGILLYRLGDFYEMFYDDAKIASKELDLVLTGRDCGQEERAPMCGIPFHSCEGYIAKLVKNGHKVFICEQTEDPKKAKGLVKREIIRTITPGTVIEASMLQEDCNNYICSVYFSATGAGVCFADITTGEMLATDMVGSDAVVYVMNELGRFLPRETLLNPAAAAEEQLSRFLREHIECGTECMQEDAYAMDACMQQVRGHFSNLEDNLLEDHPTIVCAVGALLAYLTDTQKSDLANMDTLQIYHQGQYLELDLNARRNLELFETMRTKEKKGSLLWVLDKTRTAMGARLLRQWMSKPLRNPNQILQRQRAIGELKEDLVKRSLLTDELRQMFDIERLISRIVYGTANCRDLRSMCATLEHVPAIRAQLVQCDTSMLKVLGESMDELQDIRQLISASIVDEPPFSLREGNFIREGYSEELDSLRDIASGGKGSIAAIEAREREATGIPKLKVGYNRVFGYYIEVSRLHSDKVPAHYVRKQTLANAERYITEELKQYENTVLQANERIVELEYRLFTEIREQISSAVHRIQITAQTLAQTDVLCALAEVADVYNYCCPEVEYSAVIDIRDGRHPVVERMLRDSMFIANDTLLDDRANRTAIITGPNMAGKSTYMRQVALITIMAQMGSFVPARSARIGIADRVFTRVGASDDLASGQSTFMVEMSEVADILLHATRFSLVILDEIGRGTSTFDGMSIARAVVEYISDPKKVGARTLFATHYHELTALEELLDGVKNYNIAVKKRGDDITFLRKIVPGGADDSYGIEVAKLAGVPKPVLRRAKRILKDLEASAPKIEVREVTEEEEPQISLMGMQSDAVSEKLRSVNVNTMTPIEALNLLYELQKMVE